MIFNYLSIVIIVIIILIKMIKIKKSLKWEYEEKKEEEEDLLNMRRKRIKRTGTRSSLIAFCALGCEFDCELVRVSRRYKSIHFFNNKIFNYLSIVIIVIIILIKMIKIKISLKWEYEEKKEEEADQSNMCKKNYKRTGTRSSLIAFCELGCEFDCELVRVSRRYKSIQFLKNKIYNYLSITIIIIIISIKPIVIMLEK
jgi:fucose permease